MRRCCWCGANWNRSRATDFTYPRTPFFTDVPATLAQFRYVQKMYELGLTTGCSPTSSVRTRCYPAGDRSISDAGIFELGKAVRNHRWPRCGAGTSVPPSTSSSIAGPMWRGHSRVCRVETHLDAFCPTDAPSFLPPETFPRGIVLRSCRRMSTLPDRCTSAFRGHPPGRAVRRNPDSAPRLRPCRFTPRSSREREQCLPRRRTSTFATYADPRETVALSVPHQLSNMLQRSVGDVVLQARSRSRNSSSTISPSYVRGEITTNSMPQTQATSPYDIPPRLLRHPGTVGRSGSGAPTFCRFPPDAATGIPSWTCVIVSAGLPHP